MKSLKFCLIQVVVVVGCFAQNPESLLIGPGDTLAIKVFDTPEMEQHLRVTDAGEIPLMFVGNLKVAGMTPAGAGQAIEQTLMAKQYMLHPQVSVSVEVFATLDVSVMGQVKDPGTYDLQTPTPILKILSMAGGLTDLADRSITIERHSDPSKTITYYVSNRSDEAMTNQVNVYPGDLVLVPKVGVVYVLGDVGHPGGYPMTTNDSKMTAMQAIALAGTLNHTAALSKAKLIRKTSAGLQDIPLQVSEIQRGRQPDVTLQPDDVLYIPFSWMKNAILASSSIMSTAAQSIIYAHP